MKLLIPKQAELAVGEFADVFPLPYSADFLM